jgi:hypothetical protein
MQATRRHLVFSERDCSKHGEVRIKNMVAMLRLFDSKIESKSLVGFRAAIMHGSIEVHAAHEVSNAD